MDSKTVKKEIKHCMLGSVITFLYTLLLSCPLAGLLTTIFSGNIRELVSRKYTYVEVLSTTIGGFIVYILYQYFVCNFNLVCYI